MNKKVIYLAGPLTDKDPEVQKRNVDTAVKAAADLGIQGHVVVSPHEMGAAYPESLTYGQWIEHGLEVLQKCDAIALLPGYLGSRGTMVELACAEEIGNEVFHVFFTDCGSAYLS